jgi:hypothetical protein
VYSHVFLWFLVCLFHGVGTLCHYSTVSFRLSVTDRAMVTKCPYTMELTHQNHNKKKPMAVHYSCAPDDGCCDVRNMLS